MPPLVNTDRKNLAYAGRKPSCFSLLGWFSPTNPVWIVCVRAWCWRQECNCGYIAFDMRIGSATCSLRGRGPRGACGGGVNLNSALSGQLLRGSSVVWIFFLPGPYTPDFRTRDRPRRVEQRRPTDLARDSWGPASVQPFACLQLNYEALFDW